MTTHCDHFRRQRKRVRVAARERLDYLHSKRMWVALSGAVTCRRMTPEERARYGALRKAPDPYEREEPP